MIEPYMIKCFMVFVVFMEILTCFFIGKAILFSYKKKEISMSKVISYFSIMALVIIATVIIFALMKFS